MTSIERAFRSTHDRDAQVAIAQMASPHQLRTMLCRYDWSHHPEAVLGWVMAQKSIDLDTALTVFFNGEPERFNYMPKRDVADEFRCVARVLDNICLRVNSGYYLVQKSRRFRHRDRLVKWLDYQKADRNEARRGRWILDEEIVSVLLSAQEASTEKPAVGEELDIQCSPDQPVLLTSLMAQLARVKDTSRKWRSYFSTQ